MILKQSSSFFIFLLPSNSPLFVMFAIFLIARRAHNCYSTHAASGALHVLYITRLIYYRVQERTWNITKIYIYQFEHIKGLKQVEYFRQFLLARFEIKSVIYSYYKMGKIVKKRKLFVSKKHQYRQIALARKAKWAERYQLQHEEQFKSHFCQNEDTQHEDSFNKSPKSDLKGDQKIKNRVAAQQSRQKRKCYVEEIERKLQLYEELLQTQTCRQCLGSLREKSDSDFGITTQKFSSKEEMKGEDYFEEGLIRVDNQGSTTPFSIFFFICLIAILTIFAYHGSQTIDQRLLSNNDSLLHSVIKNKEEVPMKQSLNIQKPINYLDMTANAVINSQSFIENFGENKKNLRENTLLSGSLETHDWRRYGDLMCTKSPLARDRQKNTNKPFLTLRSTSKQAKQQNTLNKISVAEKPTSSSDTWFKGDVLSCIVYG